MEQQQQRRAPEYVLEVFADPAFVKDIVKAILHTIFFHRYFTPIIPLSRDVLDLTLPCISDPDLETLIEARAQQLMHALSLASPSSPSLKPSSYGSYQYGASLPTGQTLSPLPNGLSKSRAQLLLQFHEKRRRKSYFPSSLTGATYDDIPWESWLLDVTLASPRSEAERLKVRRAMEMSLAKAAMKVVRVVGRDKEHIPPITQADVNPFPYSIVVNPPKERDGALGGGGIGNGRGRGGAMGMF